MAERQSARMSKITNDGLTHSGTQYTYGTSGRQRVNFYTRCTSVRDSLGISRYTAKQ